MIKIKDGKAVWILDLPGLWWLYHHLPQRDIVTEQVYRAIVQLEEDKLQQRKEEA